MENDTEDQSKSDIVETVKLNLQDNQTMPPKKKSKFNRPFLIALVLVIVIFGVYVMSSRSNKDLTERMHNDWVKTMTKESSSGNDTVGLRHFERHEETEYGQQTGEEQTQVNMVLPAEVPEDLHKAQTQGMPLQPGLDQGTDTALQNSEESPRELIEMKLDQPDVNNFEQSNNVENKNYYNEEDGDVEEKDDGKDEYDDEDENYDEENNAYQNLEQNELQNSQIAPGPSDQNIPSGDISINEGYATNNNSNIATSVESQNNTDNIVQTNLVNMQLQPENYVDQPAEPVNDVNPDQQQINFINPAPVNDVGPEFEQANYAKPEQDQVNNVNPEQGQVNYVNPQQGQVNYVNPEQGQVNYVNPAQGQVNYVNPQQGQVNYVNPQQGQVNYVNPEQGQVNYVNPAQANYAQPELQQANYVNPQQVQMNNVNQEQGNYANAEIGQASYINPEQANFINPQQGQMNNVNQEQANYIKPLDLEQTNYLNPQQSQMNYVNQEQANYAQSELGQANFAKQEQQDFIQPEIQQVNYVRPENANFNKPVDSFINMPSNNDGFNYNQQYPGFSNDVAGGNVASDTRGQFQNGNGEYGNILDTNRLSQTYQNGYDVDERKVGKQLFNIDINDPNQSIEEPSTISPHTLADTIESRMKLHKVLKDMREIVNYGSAKTDEENKKPWNGNENMDHLYDENKKVNLFENLRMQLNLQAEPVTGTKPMRPPSKSSVQYPEYLTPINWETSFNYVKTPTFECVPMRTIDKYIRICIHPPTVRSEVSSKLKAEATWEYSALMDMQKALLQNKDAFLVDIGASFGVFSLAAAALNRNVIAVEPFPSHIQVLKQSVALNSFRNHITLFQAVISDRVGKVLIKPLGDHVDNVYIQTVEDDEQSTNYTLVVNTVTLDDIEKVCPGRVAVLKIDIPGFEKRALEYSYFFFKYIYVTHVFMHWNTNDKGLCLFVTRFFVERGYQPFSDLNGSARLDIQYAASWTNDIVIWKL